MINKYWEHSELSWVGLCVEERIDCEMSGEVCGDIDSLAQAQVRNKTD